MLQVTSELVDGAVTRGILTREQADELWRYFSESKPLIPQSGPAFTFTNVLYYLGAMLAIGAMSLFMTMGWQAFGGWGMFTIASLYAAAALWSSRLLLRRGLHTPAGILAAIAVVLVPLAIYGAQEAMGLWDTGRAYRDYHQWIDARWAVMELATLAAGALVLFWYRLPFAVMPIAVTLWYMSMDFATLLAAGSDSSWMYRKKVSMVFGLAMLALALYVDLRCRRRPDFAFWLYIFGVLAFWGSLSTMDSSSQLGKLLYACLNLLLLIVGAVLDRRVFTVCGALGLFGYLGYLSYSVFKDSMTFPFVLTALGLAVVASGVWWQRHEAKIRSRFRDMLSDGLRDALQTAQR
jgi:hypothetical protein